MGLWRDQILPRLVNVGLAGEEHQRQRREVTAGLHGTVLELGFASGLNLPHYPPAVERVLAVDPAIVGRKLARARIGASRAAVEFIGLDGQALPLPDASVDAALSTWTLCSIPDPLRALAEVRRVLEPGGSFHFLEHGLSSDPGVARWQRRLDGLQRRVFGGCSLVLPVDDLLRQAGFELAELRRFTMKGPRFATTMYAGRAVLAGRPDPTPTSSR